MNDNSKNKTQENFWKNRIVSQGAKHAKDFVANPLNWRNHGLAQREALNSVLSEIGWVQNVIVNRTSGHIIDGHARVSEALAWHPDALVPFIEVELTQDEENKILAVLDPIGAMAGATRDSLEELLKSVDFESAALAEVVAGLAAAERINTIALVTENNSSAGTGADDDGEDGAKSVSLDYLKFGRNRIPLTKEEFDALTDLYEKHIREAGTNFGFITVLLKNLGKD